MAQAFAKVGGFLLLLTVLLHPLSAAFAQGPEPPHAPVITNYIVPILQTDHATYATGQPILIRASIKNTTGALYLIYRDPFAAIVHLTVRDASGNVIKPSGVFRLPERGYMPVPAPLPAGATQVLTWRGQEWVDLSEWGYAPLGPGTYTITMLLHTGGHAYLGKADGTFTDGPDFRMTNDQGNGLAATVKISVEPK